MADVSDGAYDEPLAVDIQRRRAHQQIQRPERLVAQDAALLDVQECRILRDKPFGALDLLVRATPLDIDGERFVICAIADISHEKRL